MENQTLKDLLASRAKETPDQVILKDDRVSYTWQYVEKASWIIAEELAGLGVKRGTHVGICGENSVGWLLTFFAAQKLGALAMLINPKQTAEEIGRVCVTGDITCLCYGKISSMENAEDFLAEVRRVEDCRIENEYSFREPVDYTARFVEYEGIRDRLDQWMDPDAPGVVLFTSGSTGRPRGVILSHYNLVNAAMVQVDLMHMTKQDRELLIAPLFHILGLVVCLYPCLLVNVPLFLPDDIHSATVIRIMQKEKCTLMHSVPTMILTLLNNRDFSPEALESLRCTYLAGAAAGEPQLRMFMQKMPRNHFMIAYGLSEMAPVSVTLYGDTEEHLLHTVGRPVKNIRIRILDRKTKEECTTGETGEILVQGYNLMAGYYKLPLEDQIIDDEGWLHTGDMGQIDTDGYLRFLGRYKELIIRGGENIMPSEVETAVSALEGVDQVKVVGVPDAFFGEAVAACIRLLPGVTWDEERARESLSKTLARFKIPKWFFLYEDFPMLGSGKIDGVALGRDARLRVEQIVNHL